MLLTYKVGKYEQMIKFSEGVKQYGDKYSGGGIWHSCTCKDFMIRQVVKNPAGKCKHLKFIYEKILDPKFIEHYVSRLSQK